MRPLHLAALAASTATADVLASSLEGQGRGQSLQSTTIRAARVLDGVGGTLANGVVEVRGTEIAAIDQRTGRGVLPSFSADAILDNARATLMAGFTTVQSLGWAGDKGLRQATRRRDQVLRLWQHPRRREDERHRGPARRRLR